MRVLPALILASATISALSGDAAAPVKAPFSITINVPSSTVKVGSVLKVEITLTNISDHKIELFRAPGKDNGEFNSKLEILQHSGKAARETNYRKLLRREPSTGNENERVAQFAGSEIAVSVDPGKSIQDAIVANRLYDLSEPGKYAIQVSRFDRYYSRTWVRSNRIILTVTP